MPGNESPSLKLVLRPADLVERTGLCRRTIERMIRRGDFPPATIRSKKVALWSPAVVEQWSRGEWRPARKGAAAKK
jgi:predicted DNA-binding transcriptional regulator AlpA